MKIKGREISFRKLISKFSREEIGLLLIALLIIASVWIFIEIADEVLEGETRRFDEMVVKAFRDPNNLASPKGPEFMRAIVRDITALGGATLLPIILLIVFGFLILQRNYSSILMIVSANIGGFLLVTILKFGFSRDRPDIVPQLMTETTPSFPSGHSMMSTVAYLTLAVLLAINFSEKKIRVYIIAVAFIISVLIGISRIYLGVHYPTDVLAGWAVGLAWASLCGFVARFIHYIKKRN